MPSLLITRPIGPDATAILEQSGFNLIMNPEDAAPTREWVLGHLANPDVHGVCIMHPHKSDRVDEEFLNACNPNLKVISTMSVGYDHIDVEGAKKRGIKVGHTPGVLDDSVADITVMLVLMTMRRVEEGIQIIKAGEWPTLPWGPFVMTGPSIGHPNLTFGFLGFGRISQETVKRLLAFANKSQPPTIIYNSSRARRNQQEIDAEYTKKFGVTVQRVEKDELAARSDVLIVLCVQNESTINLVNKDFLRKMKKSAVLINSARGPIVNSEDLAWALDQGEIYGAGLDVITHEPNVGPDHPLVQHRRCVVIPHMGSADFDTRIAMASRCARNCIQGARGEALEAEVP
ncbi:hypothetical protein DB88DRAFT_178414 [Papiliotrema laurentii]|uniref:Glyoxylate reductase n=1 Tax=Papiliotrema laurentii TaxID=5418 RepID=A0AAD9L832_PAPLA|nr:hypothetical protein DB88DRAFT_178414 [Papiliotrema laurentii]